MASFANFIPYQPNMTIIQFILDNIWTVEQLETYVVNYQPGGVSLFILRRALGHGRVDAGQYARTLAKTAAVLYYLGHVKTVPEVFLELLLRVNPLVLTLDQVGVSILLYAHWVISWGGGKKRGGGRCDSVVGESFFRIDESCYSLRVGFV
jgi:hypothetical protein